MVLKVELRLKPRTKVEGGVGKGRCFEVDGGFVMTFVDIGYSTTGGESIGSLGSTKSRISTIS